MNDFATFAVPEIFNGLMNSLLITLLYLDPGTGSILIQFVIAVVAGIGIFFNTIKEKIGMFFDSLKKNKKR